ncbi:MAG: Na(+)-translocating NADH-quinone reductase subunit C [Myxococcota bacterium]|nr:Na(+)-translocating NADH-quinone reductase subunit C [Myxococcota bacterium]
MEHNSRNTVIFTTVLCVVFSVLVSAVAVALKDRQDENKRLDRIRNVLVVAGLVEPSERPAREELMRRFEEKLEPRVVELSTGRYLDDVDPHTFDPQRAVRDPDSSSDAPENAAKVRRLPNHTLVYVLKEGGVILPIEGYGLWSTLYGYLALESDAETIRGITFYQHGETAGLGGEVDNPRWKALWPGRRAFDPSGDVAIHVVKGMAGPPDQAPYEVDGLSGATLTSNGVTNMLRFWLGENGFKSYLAEFRKQRGMG